MILGASPDPLRFSNKMVKSLIRYNYEPVPIGIREGKIAGIDIIIGKPKIKNTDTICMYLNSSKQNNYSNYIINLQPRRIIFNPGSHNAELAKLAEQNNIECVYDCFLIMISKNSF